MTPSALAGPVQTAPHPLVLEPEDEIVRITHDECLSLGNRPAPLPVKPQIQNIVQIDIGEHWRDHRSLRRAVARIRPCPVFHDTRVQPLSQQPNQPPVTDAVLHKPYQPIPRDRVEVRADVRIDYPTHLSLLYPVCQCIERIVRPPPRPESIAESEKLRLVYRRQDHVHNRLLDYLVLHCRDPERSCPTVRLGDVHPPNRRRPVRPVCTRRCRSSSRSSNPSPSLPTSSRPPPAPPPGSVPSRRLPALPASGGGKRSETLLRVPLYRLPYPVRRLCHTFPALRPACALTSRIPLG